MQSLAENLSEVFFLTNIFGYLKKYIKCPQHNALVLLKLYRRQLN